MANFYVANSRYPDNPQLFTISITKFAKKGGEINPNFKPSFPSGEPYWSLLIHTSGKDVSGNTLNPVVADVLGSEESVKELIDAKIAELCALIDWSEQGTFLAQDDVNAPYIVEQRPSSSQSNVGINSTISFRIRDGLPATGIDISTLSLRVNGISVTPNVSGNKFDYTISFKPRPVYDS